MIVTELYRYPLKGGHAETLQTVPALNTGFPGDRTWLLVDPSGRFVSQRECSALTLVQTHLSRPTRFQFQDQTFDVDPEGPRQERAVTVWKDTLPAWDLGDAAAAFFSQALGRDLRLCVAKDERKVDTAYTESKNVDYYFADAFPYLVISQESLDLLNAKLGERGQAAVPMDRFRANIVIKGWQPHGEDAIQTICIGGKVRLRLSKLCSRCNVTTIDQNSGKSSSEPLATLATYRKLGTSKIYFGTNAWVLSGAGNPISVGDSVTIE